MRNSQRYFVFFLLSTIFVGGLYCILSLSPSGRDRLGESLENTENTSHRLKAARLSNARDSDPEKPSSRVVQTSVSEAGNPEYPQPPSPVSYGEKESLIAQELRHAEGDLTTKIRIVSADFKYPLLRVEEVFAGSEGSGSEAIRIGGSVMVADHILLRCEKSRRQEITMRLAQLGYAVGPGQSPSEPFLRVVIPTDEADALPKAMGIIERSIHGVSAEPDYLVSLHLTPDDPLLGMQWSLANSGQTGGTAGADIKAPVAWDKTTGSGGVTVAVLDTGIDFTHPDLAGNLYFNAAESEDGEDTDGNGFIDDLRGWDFYNGSNNPTDGQYHGTHVAGTIGARGNNGIGITGVSWRARILAVRVFSDTGAGTLSDAVQGIRYAADSGARVINASWGFRQSSELLSDAIDYAGSKGCLLVASAGNDGLSNDLYPIYPASTPLGNVISVAATDHDDRLAGFSNYGNSVDIAAPGVGILSTTPLFPTLSMIGAGIPAEYGHSSGTSMSAPHVSGAAVLLISQNPGITALEVKQLLMDRAIYTSSLAGLTTNAGRLDVGNLFETEQVSSPASLVFHSVRWMEKGNTVGADDIVRPGEEVELEINMVNEGTSAAMSGSLTVEILSGHAVLVGGTTIGLGTIPGKDFRGVTPLPFVRVLPDSPDNLSVRVRMTLAWAGGAPVSKVIEIPVVNLQNVQAVQKLSFQVSEVLAAPTPNLVYMLSPSDWRVLAFDTQLAKFTQYQQLGVKPSDPGSRVFGGMAVNQAGNRLFVTIPKLKQIHVLSLPSMSPLAVLNTSFEPNSLALDSRDRLFASTYDGSGPLRQLSTVDGSVIGIHSGDIPNGNNLLGFRAVLKTNEARTRLYASDARGLGPGTFQTWDVGSPAVGYLGGPNILNGFITDFAVDAENERIFSTHQAINSLQVSHFNPQRALDYLTFRSNGGDVLSSVPGGAAVSFAPGKNYVLAASSRADSTFVNRFKRDTGEHLGSYLVMSGYNGEEILPRSLCVTENDRAVFIGTVPSRYAYGAEYKYDHYINLISATTVNPVVPAAAVPPAAVELVSVSLQDFGGNADGVPNPGENVSLRFAFKNLGGSPSAAYSLQLASTNPAASVSGSPIAVPSILGGDSYLTPAMSVDLGNLLPDGSEVTFNLTLFAQGAPTYIYIHRITIRATSPAAVAAPAAFTAARLTGIVASPTLNEVYLADASGGRVIAMDTTLGTIRKISKIPNEQRLNMTIPVYEMGIAISPDGSRLALFPNYGSDVHVFRLPDLVWLDAFTLPQSNYGVVFDSQNNIHAAGRPDPQVNSCQILKVDGQTGGILATYGSHTGGVVMLRASPGGDRLAMSYKLNNFYPVQGGTAVYRISGSGSPGILAQLPEPATYLVFRDSAIWMPSGTSIREYNLISGTYGRSTAGTDFFTSLNLTPNDRFVCSNETVIREYQSLVPKETVVSVLYNQQNAGRIRPNGVVITPDGRISYLTDRAVYFPAGVSNSDPWSGFGIIGQQVSLEEPSELPVKLQRADILDAAPGNANGYAEPGETIQISPFFRNTGFTGVSGLSVVITSANPNVTVIGQNSRNFVKVNALTNFNLDTAFSVLLSSNVADGESLGLSLTLSYGSVVDRIPLDLFAMRTRVAYTETNFELGETLAHPVHNFVYLVDRTNSRLLALDTDAGNIAAFAKLAGSPGGGEIAVSSDGERVAVALANANKIQILDARTLSAIDVIHLGFKPERISYASDNAIYANSSSNRQIMRIDPDDGEALSLASVSVSQVYQPSAEIREPFVFTTTFAGAAGGGGGGRKFSVPIHMLGPTTFVSGNSGRDLAFDPDGDRIYTACNARGGYVTRFLGTGESSVRYDPSSYSDASAIALHTSLPFLYVGEDKTYNPFVNRIDRRSGKVLARFAGLRTSTGAGYMKPRSLEVTRNGKVFFATGDYYTTVGSRIYGLHLIGATSLSLSLPAGKVPLDTGSDLTVKVTNPATFAPRLDFMESSDVRRTKLAGPGSVSFSENGNITTANFSQPGVYQLEFSSAVPGMAAKDRVVVKVQPADARIEAEVIRPVATSLPLRPAILRVYRTGDVSGALNFSIGIGGTATSGLHYVPIAGQQRFEAGVTQIEIEIVPTQYGGITDEAMTLNILPADGYKVDTRVFAFRLLEGDFDTLMKDLREANPELSITPEGDNNGNGIPNLLEYTMGADPLGSSSPYLDATHNPRMRLHFQRRERLADASLVVEFSPDMKNWYTEWKGKPAVWEVFRFPEVGGPERVTVELSPEAAAEPNGFLRLKALRNP